MLCVVTEETERVISERRMATLRDLAAGLAAAVTEAEVLSTVREQLGKNTRDVPFSITYLFDARGRAILSAHTGISESHPAACPVLEIGADAPWPVSILLESVPPSLLANLTTIFPEASLPTGFWDQPPQQAALVPIRQQGNERPAEPRKALDKANSHGRRRYTGFHRVSVGLSAA